MSERMSEKLLLSVSEASKLCGYTDEVLANQIKLGNLEVFVLFERKHPKIPLKALNKWIDERTGKLPQEIIR